MSSRPRLAGRPTTAEHQAAVARRLDQLRAELAGQPRVSAQDGPGDGVAGGGGDGGEVDGGEPWWGDATRIRPSFGEGLSAPATVEPSPVPASNPSGPSRREDQREAAVLRALPMPGRHASRRARQPRAGLVPPRWQDRFVLGPAQLSVVAVVVALGLAVTAWLVVRASPAPVPVAASSSAGDDGTPGSPAQGALVDLDAAAAGPGELATDGAALATEVATAEPVADAGGVLTVDVAGKVRRPGIAVLQPGARVVDAIDAAGGARAGVDLTPLNLARPLVDGEQVLVGVQAPAGASSGLVGSSTDPSTVAGASGTPADGSVGALVDLNAATEDQLDTLPEVGPVTAASIVAWRNEHGGFSAVEELLEVDGIGEATLSRIAPHVTV